MALETLKDLEEIGGFQIVRDKPDDMNWDEFDSIRDKYPINITEKLNSISFKIQNGPIKEVGVNGCQVDTLIHAAKAIIKGFNEKFPCIENRVVIGHLKQAIYWLNERTKDRENRGVEGTNQA